MRIFSTEVVHFRKLLHPLLRRKCTPLEILLKLGLFANRKIQQPAAAAGFFVFKAPCHGTKALLYLEKQFTQEDAA